MARSVGSALFTWPFQYWPKSYNKIVLITMCLISTFFRDLERNQGISLVMDTSAKSQEKQRIGPMLITIGQHF